MRSFKEFKEAYKGSLKSMDTEETIDLMFYRPIGFAWALLAAKFGITPNMITIASIFLGVAGGVLFYFYEPQMMWLNIVGMLLLVWANSFDSADGQLARMTKQYSRLGRILDGVSGDFWFIAIYFSLVFREIHSSAFFMENVWAIWVMAVLAGLCHAKQAAMADYYRQFHLYFLKGEEGSELDSTEQLDRDNAGITWKTPLKKITSITYRNYTAQQEGITPAMQALRSKLKATFGEGAAAVPQTFRDAFRAKSKPLMKYTNMLSFNTRVIALFVSILARMPWLYFAFELVVLNTMLVYMILRHERICRGFVAEIEEGKYVADKK
ncbi:MAG: CDP-alcohol phosphatidyltransferase family protein [bacterium]|nr:CDP-alcohol phosphatidyltransferase family protein [bacterium]